MSIRSIVILAAGLIMLLEGGPQPHRSVPAVLTEKLAQKLREGEDADAPRRFTDAAEAQEFFALKRLPVGETSLPVARYAAARRQMDLMPRFGSANGVDLPPRGAAVEAAAFATPWTELGPGNIGGRTRAMVIDPTNPEVMYIGGVAGGVWKTTDGGGSWTPLDDFMANLAVSSLAMDPSNSNVLYAGTGEGYFNGDSVRGAGIFKTTNGGATWTQLPATNDSNFHYVNDLIVSDNNAQHVYAATRNGVWYSLDGGGSWTQAFDASALNGCMDLAARTDTATDYLFAACGTFTQAQIYRNTDAAGAGAWVPLGTEFGQGRTSLAIAPSNQNVIYALSASVEGGSFRDGLYAVFRSTSSGDPGTWTARVRNTSPTQMNTLLLSNTVYGLYSKCFGGGVDYYFNQGWYDNVIAVDPVNSNRVWVGGIDLFRSTDGGANWGVASRWWGGGPAFNHADQHGIVFHPAYNGTTNQIMYTVNDGGVRRTDNAASGTTSTSTTPVSFVCGGSTPASMVNWTELNNNYRVTQFYNGVPYPGGLTYFGGTQDNGTVRGDDAGGIDGWSMIQGGDGGYVAVSATDPNTLYAEFTGISIQKSTNGGVSWGSATSGISDSGLFINPFVMDPSNSEILWTGGTSPWRTTDGAASWAQAGISFGTNVSAIAVANTSSNRVLMGTWSGSIHRTTTALSADGGTFWNSTTPRSGYVSSVAFDPSNASRAYATYSNFGGFHVWKSTDGGATFTPIDGSGATGIPDIPVHSIVVDPGSPSRLYVGTDLGVFVSRDGGATWAVENTGFANVITETLAVGNVGGVPHIFAFTHGRGAFRVSPVDTGLPSVTITASDGTATEAGTTTGTLTVMRTGSTASALTVHYTVAGTATSGSDYALLPGTITLGIGSSSAPIFVTPVNDALVESDESVVVTLSANAAYSLGSPSAATVTIVSDDVGGTANLSISSLKVPAVGGAGLSININDTTRNLGTGSAPSTTTAFHLSTDTTLSAGDIFLGSRPVPALTAGSNNKGNTAVTIPAGIVGRRYVIANADSGNVAAESNETDNALAKRIDIGPDLVVSLNGPVSATRGATVLVDVTTTNRGGAPAGATTTRVYLSTNGKVDAGDDVLATIVVPPLAAGANHAVLGLSVAIPAGTATGVRNFLAVADVTNAVAESVETNTKKQAVAINP
jgi:photosystem II stability/assembly factor-like uncharacterized protein